ncbi:hypothetical protein [Streptomyces sp. JW3]|uniref:hypothetical protein n=1 Tax=Streptomyces sp. JW3 TaxID=3456955 RepID=UPI003FA49A8B
MTNQPYDAGADAEQYTQQWQGQTWETSVQPPVPAVSAEETAYLPPQQYQQPYQQEQQYQQQQPYQQHGQYQYQQQQPYQQQQQYPQQPHPQQQYGQQQYPQPQPQPPAPEPPASPDSGYGPATVAGNARITDAQRARAEGRSPVIEPGGQPAALTALLGLLLAGGAAVGSYALLVPLVVLQAVTAAGWFRLNGMWPARQGIALGFLGALVADVALLASDRSPAALLGTIGVWVLLSLVLHLRSHADPDERMYGLTATVVASALAIVAGGWLAADADAVSVGAVAVAVGVLVRALPLPTPVSVLGALLGAAGAGFAVGGLTDLGAAPGALLGAGAALCALIGHRVASYDYPSRFVHFTAGVALPLSAAAPAVWVLGRVLG